MRLIALLLCPVLLAACVTEPGNDADVIRDDLADACGAAGWSAQIAGASATEALTALLPVSAAEPSRLRVIFPDTAVTMDVRPDRLNVEIDATDRVTRVYCG